MVSVQHFTNQLDSMLAEQAYQLYAQTAAVVDPHADRPVRPLRRYGRGDPRSLRLAQVERRRAYQQALAEWTRQQRFAETWFGDAALAQRAMADRLIAPLSAAWTAARQAATALKAQLALADLEGDDTELPPVIDLPMDPSHPAYRPPTTPRLVGSDADRALQHPDEAVQRKAKALAAALGTLTAIRDQIGVAVVEAECKADAQREVLIERRAVRLKARYAQLARAQLARRLREYAELIPRSLGRYLERQLLRGALEHDATAAWCWSVLSDTIAHALSNGSGDYAETFAALIEDSPLARAGLPRNKREQYAEYLERRGFVHENGDRRTERPAEVREDGRLVDWVEPVHDLDGRNRMMPALQAPPVTLCTCCYAPIVDRLIVDVQGMGPVAERVRDVLEEAQVQLPEETPYAGPFVCVTSVCDCTLDFTDYTLHPDREAARTAFGKPYAPEVAAYRARQRKRLAQGARR